MLMTITRLRTKLNLLKMVLAILMTIAKNTDKLESARDGNTDDNRKNTDKKLNLLEMVVAILITIPKLHRQNLIQLIVKES